MERMSEEELREYRAHVAAQQRELRRRMMERMPDEELRSYRSRVAEYQRDMRRKMRESMSDDEVGYDVHLCISFLYISFSI